MSRRVGRLRLMVCRHNAGDGPPLPFSPPLRWPRSIRQSRTLLRAHTAGEGGHGRHRQYRFAFQHRAPKRPRRSVERVPEDARHSMIVFRRDHDHRHRSPQ